MYVCVYVVITVFCLLCQSPFEKVNNIIIYIILFYGVYRMTTDHAESV